LIRSVCLIPALILAAFLYCGKDNREIKITGKQKMTDELKLSAQIELLRVELKTISQDFPLDSPDGFSAALDSAADRIRGMLAESKDPREIIRELNEIIFRKWNIVFDSKADKFENLFPHLVYLNRRGSCVGISLLYLLIGEKTGLPLYGVVVPGHFFVRYDDFVSRFNIEMMKKGAIMSDCWYLEKYAVADSEYYDLGNLNTPKIISVLRYNAGNIFHLQKKNSLAESQYRSALVTWPGYAEASGNLAVVLGEEGRDKEALDILSALKAETPRLKNIDKNLAAVMIKNGLYAGAVKCYRDALLKASSDPELYYGMAVAFKYLKDFKGAREALDSCKALDPAFKAAEKFFSELYE